MKKPSLSAKDIEIYMEQEYRHFLQLLDLLKKEQRELVEKYRQRLLTQKRRGV